MEFLVKVERTRGALWLISTIFAPKGPYKDPPLDFTSEGAWHSQEPLGRPIGFVIEFLRYIPGLSKPSQVCNFVPKLPMHPS